MRRHRCTSPRCRLVGRVFIAAGISAAVDSTSAIRSFKALGLAEMISKSSSSTTRSSHLKRSRSQYRRVVLCLRNDGYEVSLERRKLYEAIPDREASAHRQVRVIDESGEDYLYPSSHFAAIVLPPTLRFSRAS